MNPEWKDAPDSPGLWLRINHAEECTVWFSKASLKAYRSNPRGIISRYFGPIPEDKNK